MGRKKATVRRPAARRTATKKATRRKQATASLSELLQSTAVVVRDMKGVRKQLTQERDRIEREITRIDRALAELGHKGAGAASGATKLRAGSLKHYITEVLRKGGVMSVKDITAGVLGAGFKTRNKTLGTSVGIALSQMPSIKKVSRGKYSLA